MANSAFSSPNTSEGVYSQYMLGSASTEMISNPKDIVNWYNEWKIVFPSITLIEVSSCYQQDILEVFLIKGKKGKN